MGIDTLIGLLGLISAFALYFFDLRKKVDELLTRQEGILTKQQAHDLVDLYLDAVDSHIELAVTRYAQGTLAEHYRDGNLGAIRNEFERAYEHIVKKSVRKMVSSFRLRGKHRVDDLIGRGSQSHVSSAMDSIAALFQRSQEKGVPIHELVPQVLSMSRKTNILGKQLILDELDKLYPATAED